MKRVCLIFAHLLTVLMVLPAMAGLQAVYAQSSGDRISGIVLTDLQDNDPAVQAAVELLSVKDSVRLEVAVTDVDGRFAIPADPGDYIIRISYVGFLTKCLIVHHTISTNPLTLETIVLESDSEMLEGAVVEAKAEAVQTSGDTVIYNAAAYSVAEDAMLDELLKKIPGLTIDEEDNVFINGKQITQIFVNGKKYFGGDLIAGLQTIPANMVENIRTYERESDFARQTGIEDGEEQTVLDIGVKKTMFDGMQGNLNTGAGSASRYNLKATANSIKKDTQKTFVLGQNNINARSSSVSSARNLGGGASGELTRRELGFTYADSNKKRELNGNIHYNGSAKDASSTTSAENIFSNYTNFTESAGSSLSDVHNLRCGFEGEWHPDRTWTLSIHPTASYSNTASSSDSGGETWREKLDSILVNTTDNASNTDSWSASESMNVIVAKRFAKQGRSISLQLSESYNQSSSDQHTDNHTYYYNLKNGHLRDSTVRKQNILTDNSNFSCAAQLSYSEPLAKGMFLQFTVREDYRRNTSVRDVYGIDGKRKPALSSNGAYEYLNTTFTANWRYLYRRLYLTAGLNVKPQKTSLGYLDSLDMRKYKNFTMVDVAPNITFRYRKDKFHNVSLTYRSYSTLASMYNLLPVTNGTNPLYLHVGNPDLKPSFTQKLNASYNRSTVAKHKSFVVNAGFTTTANAVSNSTEYDPETGGRTVTPKNISGNWSASGNTVYSKTFKDKRFSTSNHFSLSYSNSKAYLYNRSTKSDEINVAQRYGLSDNLEGVFRNKWLETVLNIGGSYRVERSLLRPAMDREPWNINSGFSTVITIPDWKTRFNMEYYFLCQRGYGKKSLDRDYNLLNLGIGQPVFKGKGTIRLDAYDVLGQMRNQTTSFTAERRSISMYNGVNRYVMLRFIYRFKI